MDKILFILYVIAPIFVLSEFVVSRLWVPFYYYYGIPLFSRKFHVTRHVNFASRVPCLEQNLPKFRWRPAVTFKQFSPDAFAFRQKSIRNNISGLVQINEVNSTVTMTGHLYWSLLLLSLVLSIWAVADNNAVFSLFAFVFVTANVAIQRYAYTQIAEVIESNLYDQGEDL
jgi:hypothetical protein